MADIEVKIGEIVVAEGRDTILASGIGSCVVITIYDPRLKMGAMAHAMLPSRDGAGNPIKEGRRHGEYGVQDARYVETAINEMLKKMENRGAKREDLEAKIVGGANMFSSFEPDIGRDNVLSTKEKLKREGVNKVGECVGGSQGRSVEFSVGSGIVTVKTKF